MTRIQVRANERVAFIGKTDSGKTYLARHIVAPIKRLIVLDPKGTLGGSEWNLSTDNQTMRDLRRGKPGRLRIPAPRNRDWRPYLDLAWECRNVTVYIDEVYGVVPPGKRSPEELDALYTRGRELGIGVYASTQRPTWIPPFVLSEAEWLFVFRLSRPQDRKYIAGFGDEEGRIEQPIRDAHGFWTYNQKWRVPVYTARFQPMRSNSAGFATVNVAQKGA